MSIHNRLCCSPEQTTVQLSLDGVSESKSTSISLDVYSCCFTSCKNIYPISIVRPLVKGSVDNRSILDNVVDDLSNSCQISQFIGDNPKRAIVRCALNHASNYACEYCSFKASKFIDKTVDTSSSIEKISLYEEAIDSQIELLRNTPVLSHQTGNV